MLHPVGPHDAQTYWIRRAIVAIVAVALVVGVVWWALARTAGSGSGPDRLAATTTDTTTPQLTGVLATNPSSDSTTDLSESEMQFEEPDLAAADVSETTTGASTDASGSVTTNGTPAETGTTGDTAAGATKTTAAAAAADAKATTAPATAPTGPRVVETTVAAPVTVTVTKLVPATATAAKTAPTTTAPPKPSYDSAGRLICPASSISLTGVVWGTVAGQQPRLGLNVTNVGKQSCRQDVSGAKQVYTVYTAAGDRVWSTADCFPGEGTEVRTMGPGQKASFVIIWSGTTSEPGCNAPREKVKAGKYKLVVQLGELKSKPLAFTMS
jgi:hypothetical protein